MCLEIKGAVQLLKYIKEYEISSGAVGKSVSPEEHISTVIRYLSSFRPTLDQRIGKRDQQPTNLWCQHLLLLYLESQPVCGACPEMGLKITHNNNKICTEQHKTLN